MLQDFQKLFVSPINKNKLQYNGTFDSENWHNGFLQQQDEEVEYNVVNGIPCFVDSKDDPWSDYDKLEEQLGESPEGVVEKNWLGLIKNESLLKNMVGKIVSISSTQDGLILEIGCGPGGGLTPLVLNKNSNSKILLNDYGFWILSETQNFIKKANKWKNVSMAQFDATKMPLCDNSFDIIQSFGGFSNMKNSN